MLIDITGTILIPGNRGIDCPGNGSHLDEAGKEVECCCDECDYMQCCTDAHDRIQCRNCTQAKCPNAGK